MFNCTFIHNTYSLLNKYALNKSITRTHSTPHANKFIFSAAIKHARTIDAILSFPREEHLEIIYATDSRYLYSFDCVSECA